MAVTKLSVVCTSILIISSVCAFTEAEKLNGPNRSHSTLEGPHIKNMGYSGNIPEPKFSVRKNQHSQRKLMKGESCDEDTHTPQCAVLRSSFNPRISKDRNGGTRNEPVHPGPLKIEIRNLNLKPIKNATSVEFSARGIHVDYGVSLMSGFLFRTIVTLVFVKAVKYIFNILWTTAWKYAGWGVDHDHTAITIGGFGHPFAHYSTGWSDGSESEFGNSYGHNPYSFSYHDHSLHRPTGNIYYPGNKYYAGSHTDVKALKKAAKKYGKKHKKSKGSKYFLQPLEYLSAYDEKKRR